MSTYRKKLTDKETKTVQHCIIVCGQKGMAMNIMEHCIIILIFLKL